MRSTPCAQAMHADPPAMALPACVPTIMTRLAAGPLVALGDAPDQARRPAGVASSA
jgi:hypothetical protein